MSEVPAVATPVSEASAVKAITNKLLPTLGVMTQEAGQLFLSQIWLETGRGSSMFCNNWGNITAGKSWTGDFWRPPWFDKLKVEAMPDGAKKTQLLNLHQQMIEGKAPQKFRAYPTSTAGLEDYIARLSREFRSIVEAAKTGDALVFARAIKSSGYTPDIIPERVANTIRSLMNEFTQKGLFASLPKASAPVPVFSSALPSSGQPEPSSGVPLPSSPASTHDIVPGSGELPIITFGSVGSAVELFRFLTIGGTGVITENDDKAIRNYQTSNGLKRDGDVGPLTWGHVLDSHGLRKKV